MSNLIDFQEESGLIDLSSPQKFKEPKEREAYHEESREHLLSSMGLYREHALTFQTGSALLDLVEVVSDAAELPSPEKGQEIDGNQEAKYNQGTEENEESEENIEDDAQCRLLLSVRNSLDNY